MTETVIIRYGLTPGTWSTIADRIDVRRLSIAGLCTLCLCALTTHHLLRVIADVEMAQIFTAH